MARIKMALTRDQIGRVLDALTDARKYGAQDEADERLYALMNRAWRMAGEADEKEGGRA